MKQFELKLSNGKVVIWDGKDGVDAAIRYETAHNTEYVYVTAWRDYPRNGMFLADCSKVIQ